MPQAFRRHQNRSHEFTFCSEHVKVVQTLLIASRTEQLVGNVDARAHQTGKRSDCSETMKQSTSIFGLCDSCVIPAFTRQAFSLVFIWCELKMHKNSTSLAIVLWCIVFVCIVYVEWCIVFVPQIAFQLGFYRGAGGDGPFPCGQVREAIRCYLHDLVTPSYENT